MAWRSRLIRSAVRFRLSTPFGSKVGLRGLMPDDYSAAAAGLFHTIWCFSPRSQSPSVVTSDFRTFVGLPAHQDFPAHLDGGLRVC